MSGKKPVKKNRKSAASYAQELERRKELWTIKVLAYTQQEMLDAAALTLNEEFALAKTGSNASMKPSSANTPSCAT